MRSLVGTPARNQAEPESGQGILVKSGSKVVYLPLRAVRGSCALAVALGSHGALEQTSSTAASGQSCTVIQQVSVGLDLNLPIGSGLAQAGCELTRDPASATAAWLAAVGWVLRLLAWGFAALFIAGFTSAVRKT